MNHYICFDVGGTAIKHGVLTEQGDFLAKGSEPTMAQEGGTGILRKLRRIAGAYRERFAVSGICVSTAGMVDCETGVITYSAPLIPDYIGTDIKGEMQNAFGIPCEVENDVNCAGLAEAFSGAAKGCESCLCLTVGTGIGGAFIRQGRVHHGFSGSGCEIGYMHLPGGEFQNLASVTALIAHAEKAKKLPAGSLDGKSIFALAKQGDRICAGCIDDMCDVLGMGIANLCYVLNPEAVVLGGGIMAQEEYLAPRLHQSLKRYLLPAVERNTSLRFAQYRNDAGMIGAYRNFLQVQNSRKNRQ